MLAFAMMAAIRFRANTTAPPKKNDAPCEDCDAKDAILIR
jgi:SRSO17 transposase